MKGSESIETTWTAGSIDPSVHTLERNGGMILIDNMLFEQEWFSELSLKKRMLYIYLLCKASKVGAFEINLRKMSYDINADDGSPVTEDDIFKSFGNRIVKIADKKGLIVDYISFNWMRGKPLDPIKNPLHRGLAQELARYNLTFSDVNRMSTKHNLKWVSDVQTQGELTLDDCTESDSDPEILFDRFWKSYPSSCPRKVDKKKCHDKFMRLIESVDDPASWFSAIEEAIGRWKQSEMWTKNGGQFIMAPLRWLNGECWNDTPTKGMSNDTSNRYRKADNYLPGTVEAEDSF